MNASAFGVILRGVFSRPVLMVVAALAGGVAGGMLSRGCQPPPKPEVQGAQESTRTEPARDARDWTTAPTAPPPQIVVMQPPADERALLAALLKRPDLERTFTPENIQAQRQLGIITQEQADAAMAAYRAEQERLARENHDLKDRILQFEREITARRAIPPAPWGGVATSTVSRITGETDIDFERKPRPRVNLLLDFGVGARYSWSDAEIEGFTTATPTTETASAYLFAEPVEFGRRFPTVLRFDAGWQKVVAGDLEGDGFFASVGFETHFNRDRRVKRRAQQEQE